MIGMIMTRLLGQTLIFVLFLCGCALNENAPQKAELPVDLPEQYSNVIGAGNAESASWRFFESAELEHLVASALENSFDIKAVRARQLQAQASVKKADAAFLPALNYSIGGQRNATRVKKTTSSPSRDDSSHSWDVSATGTWTPDIWGEVAAGSRSKKALAAAVDEDLEAARQDLVRQIAEHWIDIIAARSRMEILDRQIEVNEAQLDLQKFRYANGKANALDVSQQSEALAQIRAQKPLLERNTAILVNAIGLLSGKAAPDPDMVKTNGLPGIQDIPQAGLPSDLLAQRPDIRGGQYRLEALAWDVKEARADLLPSLALTARALFSSGSLDLLFDNWVATLAAALTGPLFDGGLKKAELERRKAVVKEQTAVYAKLVAGAIFEIEDLLATVVTQDEYIRLLEQELAIAKLTLKDAQIQYMNGKSSYLTYLTVLNRSEKLERQLIEERASALKYRVRLHRALGFKGIEPLYSAGATE